MENSKLPDLVGSQSSEALCDSKSLLFIKKQGRYIGARNTLNGYFEAK